MTYYDQENQFLRQRLQKEIPILTALIQNLYQELDRKFHLNGAKIPVTFGFETDSLGSYTRQSAHEKEHFHFSLLFVGYSVEHPLSRDDRMDLYKHEYAHYMQAHMKISWMLRSSLSQQGRIRCQKRTVSIYSSMNMRITCSTICGYLRSINGRLEHMEVRGNIVVLL